MIFGCKYNLMLILLLPDLVLIHNNVRYWPELLEVLSNISLRDFRFDSCHIHAVLLLGLPASTHSAQRLMFTTFDMLLQAWHCRCEK